MVRVPTHLEQPAKCLLMLFSHRAPAALLSRREWLPIGAFMLHWAKDLHS